MVNDDFFIFGIAIVLVGLIVDVKYGLLFSSILLSVFLIMFINNKKMMKTNLIEGYESTTIGKPKIDNNIQYAKRSAKPCLTSYQFKIFADPARKKPQIVEMNMKSKNHMLEGAQNPKTLIPAMITRPMYDMEWRKSSQIVPNIINGQTNENLHLSGYLTGDDSVETTVVHRRLKYPQEAVENGEVMENYDPSYNYAEKTWDNSILVGRGYDPDQLKATGFPGNLPAGNCMRNPKLKSYNDNVFTQTVQPGVYYKTDVAEPINSNIGISFQQQFNPRTYKESNGNLDVVDHDPNFAPDAEEVSEYPEEPDVSNVYDPRFYGYGTSYRNYVDSVTGQPRFPYDDINATKMPNYIVRSKLDTHNFSDTYGPMQNAGLSLNEVRKKAQDAFLEDSLHHRNDMTTRLMRKRNAEMWQEKMYPKSRAYFR